MTLMCVQAVERMEGKVAPGLMAAILHPDREMTVQLPVPMDNGEAAGDEGLCGGVMAEGFMGLMADGGSLFEVFSPSAHAHTV